MTLDEFLNETDPKKVGLKVPSVEYLYAKHPFSPVKLEDEPQIYKGYNNKFYCGNRLLKNAYTNAVTKVYRDTGEIVSEADLKRIATVELPGSKNKHTYIPGVEPVIQEVVNGVPLFYRRIVTLYSWKTLFAWVYVTDSNQIDDYLFVSRAKFKDIHYDYIQQRYVIKGGYHVASLDEFDKLRQERRNNEAIANKNIFSIEQVANNPINENRSYNASNDNNVITTDPVTNIEIIKEADDVIEKNTLVDTEFNEVLNNLPQEIILELQSFWHSMNPAVDSTNIRMSSHPQDSGTSLYKRKLMQEESTTIDITNQVNTTHLYADTGPMVFAKRQASSIDGEDSKINAKPNAKFT